LEQIKYLDTPRLQIVFTCLVFKVSSLHRCGWTLKEFAEHIRWSGITNGRLLIVHEMNMPGNRLLGLADALGTSTKLQEWEDFVYVEEQLVRGVGDRLHPGLGLPLDKLAPCTWLDSMLTEEGNFIWLRTETEA
jgi:hypothetical protein